MRLCTRTVEPLVSRSTIQISQQNVAYNSGVSVIQQPRIHITPYHLLVTGTDAYTQYLVNEISNYSSIQGCNTSLDRYFPSVSLAEWAFVLDTCRTNVKTILGNNNIKVTNFGFTYELGKALVLPCVQRRFENPNGLQIRILNKMRRGLNIQEVNHRAQIENQRTKSERCFKFVDEIFGTADYKNKCENLNNKLKLKCHICSQFLCKVHEKSTNN